MNNCLSPRMKRDSVRSPGRKAWIWSLLTLFLILFLLGCSSTLRQLDSMKEDYHRGNFTAIAAQEVDCRPGDEGCNQVRLIRGDACYRLAKQGVEKKEHYACAAQELQAGIRQTESWDDLAFDLSRAALYANLCESLRNLQDLQAGEAAGATGDKLLAAAREFYRLEPDHPAAGYFLTKARFRKIQPQFVQITEENRKRLCQQVRDMSQAMQEALDRFTGTEYEANYRVFIQELKMTEEVVLQCP